MQYGGPVDPLELVAFVAWCFAVALAGGLVGLVLGNIRLPLVLLLASSPAAGAGANIGISGIAALTAATVHVRAGRINWRLFAWMAPPSMAGAVAGGYLSGLLPGDVLLAIIGAAAPLLRRRPAAPAGAEVRSARGSGARARHPCRGHQRRLIGVLGGLVGLILGALRMPALLRYVGETPARAVGTNLTVGVCVGAAGVIGHTPEGVDWDLLGIGAAASVPGALLGARLTGRLERAGSAAGDRRRAARSRLSHPRPGVRLTRLASRHSASDIPAGTSHSSCASPCSRTRSLTSVP